MPGLLGAAFKKLKRRTKKNKNDSNELSVVDSGYSASVDVEMEELTESDSHSRCGEDSSTLQVILANQGIDDIVDNDTYSVDVNEPGSERRSEISDDNSTAEKYLDKYFDDVVDPTCDNQVGRLLKNNYPVTVGEAGWVRTSAYPCTIGEANGRNPSGKYDVLIACSMDKYSKPKVMKLVGHLERQGLKVCLPARDLLVGLSLPMVYPELVTNRCRYTILCLSRSFFEDKECLYQMEIAQWKSAGHLLKRCLLVKLEDYEDAVSTEHAAFKILFDMCRFVSDLSTEEAWEFPNLIYRLRV